MKPCPEHKIAVPPKSREAASWAAHFQKLHGHYPLPCKDCGYLVLEPNIERKLAKLVGSAKGKPEFEKLINLN